MPTLPWRFLILTEGGADSASPSALGRLHTLEPVPPAGVPVAPPGAGAIGATAPGAGAATGSAAAGTEAGTPAADRWLAALGARFELPLTGNRTAAVTVDRLAALSPKTLRASLPDGAAGTELDAVLHHPAVQRLESAARGIDLLCRAAPAGFEIEVLAATRAELVARFRELVFDPRATGPAEALPSLILADYDFSHRAGDLAILRELAGLARILQAPVVAGASPGFFGWSMR